MKNELIFGSLWLEGKAKALFKSKVYVEYGGSTLFFWNRSETSEFDNYSWDEFDSPPISWYMQRFFLFALIVVGGIGIGVAMYGQAMAEKSLTAILQPVGLVWICLALMAYFGALRKKYIAAGMSFFCWLVITVAGNQFVCNSLAQSVESRYYHMNPYEGDDYQYGMVLGGGASIGPNGLSQLNLNGDRLSVALRMYRGGKIKKLICSGTNSFEGDETKSPAETTSEILQGLGVAESDLLTLPGDNTFQEMENLKRWMIEQNEAGIEIGHVAIISSAWHLPRVKRLAREQEIDNADLVPANFLSAPDRASPHMVVPGSYQILVTSQILKELFAGTVNR